MGGGACVRVCDTCHVCLGCLCLAQPTQLCPSWRWCQLVLGLCLLHSGKFAVAAADAPPPPLPRPSLSALSRLDNSEFKNKFDTARVRVMKADGDDRGARSPGVFVMTEDRSASACSLELVLLPAACLLALLLPCRCRRHPIPPCNQQPRNL